MYSVFGKLCISIFALAVVVFPSGAFSQTKIEGKSSGYAKSKAGAKREKPSARLPYNAVPIAEYLDKLISAVDVKPRGEFETKEAYEARLSQTVAVPPAYVLIEADRRSSYYYNVDDRVIEIYIPGVDLLKPRKSLKGTPFKVALKSEDRGAYTGSNGYGATVKVERTYLTQYLLYVEQEDLLKMVKTYQKPLFRKMDPGASSALGRFGMDTGIVIQFSIDPSQAKQLSESFQIYMKIVADGSVGFEATNSTKPTIKEPQETTLFNKAASVKVEELIVRDEVANSEVFKLTFQ